MKLYSLKEMSKLWGLSDGLLRRYCRDGRIPEAVLEDGSWWIPEGTEKPKGTYKKAPAPVLTSLAKRIIYEHSKNNHHGIYEYIQVNLAYSSCRMASNRLTRKQVIEVYRTDKISSAFEPMKVDDLIEMINHFICMRHVIDTLMEPLTQSYIKRLHTLLTYGTYADRKQKIGTGEYRTKAASIGKKPACPPKDINKALGDLINEYEATKTSCTIERILDFHVRFERIRPFDDYNGRIGRIIMMKECVRRGVDPFVIGDKNRSAYHKGLSEWDNAPELLLGLVHDEQELLSSKRELCKLMQYQRPPIR